VLQGSLFEELSELLSFIQEISREEDRATLDAVFQEWMIRLQNWIDENGEYVEWRLSYNVQFLFLDGRSCDATIRWNTLHLERENKTSDLQGREGNLESAEE
jgi:hypothetical protein